MSGLVANLTVVAMLTHAVLGCCWHHGHAAQPEQPGRQTLGRQIALLSHADCHHDGHSCSHGIPQQDDHSAPNDCDGGHCLFVTPTRTNAAQQVSADQGVASLALVESYGLPASSHLCRPADLPNRPNLSGPLYVWCQVFLL